MQAIDKIVLILLLKEIYDCGKNKSQQREAKS